jgi:hypothetical protein
MLQVKQQEVMMDLLLHFLVYLLLEVAEEEPIPQIMFMVMEEMVDLVVVVEMIIQ